MDYSLVGFSLLLRAASVMEVLIVVCGASLMAGYVLAMWHRWHVRTRRSRWLPIWR